MFKYLGVFLDQASFSYTQHPCCSWKGEPPSKSHHSVGDSRHAEENYGRKEEVWVTLK